MASINKKCHQNVFLSIVQIIISAWINKTVMYTLHMSVMCFKKGIGKVCYIKTWESIKINDYQLSLIQHFFVLVVV